MRKKQHDDLVIIGYGVTTINKSFKSTTFPCNIRDAVFINCAFKYCRFDMGLIKNTTFIGCSFKACTLVSIEFRNVTISGGKIEQCNFWSSRMINLKLINRVKINKCSYFGNNCPPKGEFIGFKMVECNAVRQSDGAVMHYGEGLAVLRIPARAKRSSATTDKCRCSEAEVIRIDPINVDIGEGEIYRFKSMHCPDFYYKVGEIVRPVLPFDENPWNECASGIHFFMNASDALNYCQ